MREYTFLMSNSFRTEHVKARNLREAFKKIKVWFEYQKLFGKPTIKENLGRLSGAYQDCGVNDYLMSGWKTINDKKILKSLERL